MITLLNKFDDNYVIKAPDVYAIIDAYIKENNLEPYLSNVFFLPETKYIAYYNLKTNELIFNDRKIMEYNYELYDRLFDSVNIDEEKYTYFLNFYYLYIIYHELMHVSQKYQYEKSVNSNLYHYLYDLCLKLRMDDISYYQKNHNLFPMEIEANNFGYLKAYQLMEHTKLPGSELRAMYLQCLDTKLSNYEKVGDAVISPIYKLIHGDEKELQKIYEYMNESKLSLTDRFNLGLDITTKEFDNIEKQKQKILNHR